MMTAQEFCASEARVAELAALLSNPLLVLAMDVVTFEEARKVTPPCPPGVDANVVHASANHHREGFFRFPRELRRLVETREASVVKPLSPPWKRPDPRRTAAKKEKESEE